MPPTPPDHPVGAAAASRPSLRMPSLAPLGGALPRKQPASARDRAEDAPIPSTPGLAEAAAPFLHDNPPAFGHTPGRPRPGPAPLRRPPIPSPFRQTLP